MRSYAKKGEGKQAAPVTGNPARTGKAANQASLPEGHRFNDIAVHAPGAKGESAGADELFTSMKGDEAADGGGAAIAAGAAADVAALGGGAVAEGTEAAAKGEGVKKVKKTELGAPTLGKCGAYSWKVRFGVENMEASTNGYIVQKINAVYNRTSCTGENKPVTGIGKFPYWEAWGVRNGKVYIGDTAQEHNADTYSDDSMGNSTKGSIVVTGTPEFYPNATLPEHMKADNPDTQAHSLRSSLTDPNLPGGTGSISHNLTATWDCCGDKQNSDTIISNKT